MTATEPLHSRSSRSSRTPSTLATPEPSRPRSPETLATAWPRTRSRRLTPWTTISFWRSARPPAAKRQRTAASRWWTCERISLLLRARLVYPTGAHARRSHRGPASSQPGDRETYWPWTGTVGGDPRRGANHRDRRGGARPHTDFSLRPLLAGARAQLPGSARRRPQGCQQCLTSPRCPTRQPG